MKHYFRNKEEESLLEVYPIWRGMFMFVVMNNSVI